MKAVLTLPSLTEDVVAEVALWEHLNAAWGGTCWVGVLVGCSHVKATCGSGVEDRGDGSLVCFLSLQAGADPPSSQSWEGFVCWVRGMQPRRLCARVCQETRGGGLLPH